MFHLVTSYYQSNHIDRQRELDDCLMRNVANPHIQTIHLLNDQIYTLPFCPDQSKIVQVVVDDKNKWRLGFDCAILYINEHLPHQHYILSNSDIYFDETLELLQNCDLTGTILGLSRYDDGHLCCRCDSQDCWIGFAPLKVDTTICSFKFGVLGCDNRFAKIIHDAGYHIYNPSKTIHTHHQHGSNHRTYDDIPRVEGMYSGLYHFIEPCELYPSS
jgi:hypothetical protein